MYMTEANVIIPQKEKSILLTFHSIQDKEASAYEMLFDVIEDYKYF